MAFEVIESLPLGRFIFEPDWTPLLGAYINPLAFFAGDRSSDPNDYLLVGGLTLFTYALHRLDPVFILGEGAGIFIYSRNLYLIWRKQRRLAGADA